MSKRGNPKLEARRVGAAERRAARALRTPGEQLKLIDERPGGSLRERARLAVAQPA